MNTEERRFHIQRYGTIPWSIAEIAYAAYAKKYGRDQSIEEINQRGGFGVCEMDMFYPDWRKAIEE